MDLTKPTLTPASQGALYAKYVLQELVHDFRAGNKTFDDAAIDKVASAILGKMTTTEATKIRSDFTAAYGKHPTDGMLAHYLINQNCQYTQKEIGQ